MTREAALVGLLATVRNNDAMGDRRGSHKPTTELRRKRSRAGLGDGNRPAPFYTRSVLARHAKLVLWSGHGMTGSLTPITPCGDCTDAIGEDVPWISRRLAELRREHCGRERPDHQVQRDFTELRRTIVRAPAEAPVEPEHQRQGAWDEQQVVEITAEKQAVFVRLPPQLIQGVERTTDGTRRIRGIAKAAHSAHAIASPERPARRSLKRSVML